MARTRAADFEEKQQGLLLIAASVFATQGMEKASMAQIAAEAGVSKSLLYHYYPSKEVLIFTIIESHLQDLDDCLRDGDDLELSPPERLNRLIQIVLEAYKGADDQHKVQLNAASALTPEQKRKIRSLERKIINRFRDVLGDLNPALLDDNGALLTPVTMSLFGMLNWVYLWFKEGGPITREGYGDLATRLILGGVFGVTDDA